VAAVKPPTLLFDLDGTLTDPREGIVGSARYAFERLGVQAPPDDTIASYIGPPLRSMFSELLTGAPRESVEDAVRLYRERYRDVGIFETRLYEGIPRMLAGARERGSWLLLATSKPWMFAERILAHLGISEHFRGVYGPELDGRLDDKGELITHLLAEERLTPGGTRMVGDRAADVVAAVRNHVEPIGVLWGYGSAEELRTAGARRLCSAPDQLEACLQGSPRHLPGPAV
jgi:phosphoglycolate phosphatase